MFSNNTVIFTIGACLFFIINHDDLFIIIKYEKGHSFELYTMEWKNYKMSKTTSSSM